LPDFELFESSVSKLEWGSSPFELLLLGSSVGLAAAAALAGFDGALLEAPLD
jgi:hypothetical protein